MSQLINFHRYVNFSEEPSAAEAIVEARNDEAAPELPQAQADIALAEPLPVKPDLSEMPILPVEVNDKQDENVGKTGENAIEQEPSSVQTEDSKKENLELAMNAEVLKQPGMVSFQRQRIIIVHLPYLHFFPSLRPVWRVNSRVSITIRYIVLKNTLVGNALPNLMMTKTIT